MNHIQVSDGKKIYFASDNHLGAPDKIQSAERERTFVAWLNMAKNDAAAIFLLGDLFDFWFEYKTVVPKGFVRTLGKLAEITDSGIPVYFFTGNHDLWMNGYFEEELGIPVYHKPQRFKINKTSFFIGHGDGLGPHDKGYKRDEKSIYKSDSKMVFSLAASGLGRSTGPVLFIKKQAYFRG